MNKFVKDMLTLANGEDFDVGRVLWAIAVLVFLGLAIYDTVAHGKPFDAQAFGIGLGSVMAAGGLALKLKHETEPK
jgi:hypothetical protein